MSFFFSCRKDWPRLFVVVVVIPFLIFLFSDFFPVDKKVQQQDGWPFFFLLLFGGLAPGFWANRFKWLTLSK